MPDWLPKLPKSCYGTYKDYKTGTARFLRWIISRAEELGLDGSGTKVFPDVDPAFAPKPKTSGGGHGKKKGGSRKAPKPQSQPAKANSLPKLPTELTVSQLLKLAVGIAAHAASRVPNEVLELLDSVIQLRTNHSTWYKLWSYIPGVQDSNVRHAHFVEVLRDVRRILSESGLKDVKVDAEAGSEEAEMQLIKRFADMSIMSLAGLEEGDVSVDAKEEYVWVPGQARAIKKPAARIPTSERPLEDFVLLLDDEGAPTKKRSTDAEVELAAWCFFQDLTNMRKYLDETWRGYRTGEVSLIAASFVTTQAVEVVKEMEADFQEAFSDRFETVEYQPIVQALLRLRATKPSDFSVILEEKPDDLYNFLMVSPYVALWKFRDVIQPGYVPGAVPGFFGKFDPQAVRSGMTSEQRKAEDFCLFWNHLPDVMTQAQLSSAQPGMETVAEASLVRDLRLYIKDRRITIDLVFQWEVWKDILLINRNDLERPLKEMRDLGKNIVRSARGWMDINIRYEFQLSGIRQAVQDGVVDGIQKYVLDDPLGEWKEERLSTKANSDIIPHAIFLFNPWACGVAASRILFLTHHIGIQLVNGSGFLSSVLQLYDALRQHGKLDAWPLLDKLLEICAPTLYPGGRPSIGSFHTANLVSLGKDPAIMRGVRNPTYRETGGGRGVLPINMAGGSLLARLSEELKHKLTDDIISKLFPPTDDQEAEIVYGRAGASGPQKLHFGGKRCDPFSLLTAVKHRAEDDLKGTAVALDLFNAELVSIALLRRWHSRSAELFRECFADTYLERESQLPFLVGYLFMALEKPMETRADPSDAQMLFREAATAMSEVRQEVERGLVQGGKVSFLP